MSQHFSSGGQSIGPSASASVIPMNIQDWFPLGITSLISMLSNGLSRVLSNTTVQKHQFFSAQPSLWSNWNNRMGKTRDLFKKSRDNKGTFHAKLGSEKDLTEAEDIKKKWQQYTEKLYKKDVHNPDSILKSRHYFADKGLSSQSYAFSSSHVWMWELDYKESWAPKKSWFWTVVLEKTLESPLDHKEI